jgi:hypothetical protein
LLAEGRSTGEAVTVLAGRFGLSDRQARRYLETAARTGGAVPAAPLVTFSVRLPAGLVARVREHARQRGGSVGAVVAEALESFLRRRGR